jgi:hypothetical protein
VEYGGAGQVSSAILEFDPASASFRTRSGATVSFQVRRQSSGREAAYVWNARRSIWRSEFEPRNVTREFAQAIAEAGELSYEALQTKLMQEQRGGRVKLK